MPEPKRPVTIIGHCSSRHVAKNAARILEITWGHDFAFGSADDESHDRKGYFDIIARRMDGGPMPVDELESLIHRTEGVLAAIRCIPNRT